MTKEKTIFQMTRVVWYILYVIEALLLFRFVLKLLGANPGATFTTLIYDVSAPFLVPFQYVFATDSVAGSLFEWSTLLAMLVYYFVAWGIVKLVLMSRSVEEQEAKRSLDAQDDV